MSNLSEQLLRGTHRIDEMQADVLKTVQALKGAIGMGDLLQRGFQAIHIEAEGGVRWELLAHKTSIVVSCRTPDGKEFLISPETPVNFRDMQQIHESLPSFIEKICKHGWIVQRLSPFFYAAENL